MDPTSKDPLAGRHCVPCREGTAPLGSDAIEQLVAQLDGWQVIDGHHLSKTYRFADFAAALAFVNRLGEVAEAEAHHPDIGLAWGRVTVELWTHAAGGLTDNDFILAAKAEALAAG